MDKLKIIRPNGEEEIAELTTDKSLVGKNYLKLDIGGVPHYAKVGDVVDTHMYTFNGVDGKKYYIKKEIGNVENPPSGDSPTLDIRGNLVLSETEVPPQFEAGIQADADKITTTSTGYQVSSVAVFLLGDVAGAELNVFGISSFYNNSGIMSSTPINVKIGDVELSAMRSNGELIEAIIPKADFMKLKENIGKPLNFSITYP